MKVCNSFALNTQNIFMEWSTFCLPLNNILRLQHTSFMILTIWCSLFRFWFWFFFSQLYFIFKTNSLIFFILIIFHVFTSSSLPPCSLPYIHVDLPDSEHTTQFLPLCLFSRKFSNVIPDFIHLSKWRPKVTF